MFITTANLLDPIPAALRDRMEVISFSSYTEVEKTQIARQFLFPKKLKEHGLTDENLSISESAIRKLVQEYTREAGVRGLERDLATICRKVARTVAEGNAKKIDITVDNDMIPRYLGRRKYQSGLMEEQDQVGAATGLVYTEFGGDVISIEVSLLSGKESRLTLTGQLGDVMKESAQAALSYVRSKARYLDLPDDFYERAEIHLHVPAGAVPKDGPSAGITIATALASALTKRAVRREVAMTGEITLRGRVLPIGGLKEKVLAAHRAGIRLVLLPADNEGDLDDIPDNVRSEMELILVSHMDEVLPRALREKSAE
jgi:ATP-dependent Lon protease